MSSSEDESQQHLAQQRDTFNTSNQYEALHQEIDLDELPQADYASQSVASTAASSEAAIDSEQVEKSPHYDEDASDSDPPDPNRPNRYYGPPSTWRDWTAPERDIARSLEQIKAKDLSVHLYNSYALRVRAQGLRNRSKVDKRRAKSIWEPPKNWAAWPMPAAEVPRQPVKASDNSLDVGELSYAILPEDSPRKDLEDFILATITRLARERFESRPWESPDDKMPKQGAMASLSQKLREISAKSKSMGSSQASATASRRSSVAPSEAQTEYPNSSNTSSESDISMDQGFESPNRGSSVTNSLSSEDDDGDESEVSSPQRDIFVAGDQQPVPLIDDAVGRQIALPSIRHIISSLEVLLTGLHESRRHYDVSDRDRKRKRRPSTQKLGSQSRPSSAASKEAEGRNFFNRDEDVGNSISSQSGYKNNSDDSLTSEPVAEPQRPASRSQSRAKSDHPYGLRDWTDILGIAAVQGWNAQTIERARIRCNALFNGHIKTTPLGFESSKGFASELQESVQGSASTAGEGREDKIEGGVHVDGFLQPIAWRKSLRARNRESENLKQREKRSRSRGSARTSKGSRLDSGDSEDEAMDES